jgi:hypothetical protein
LRCDAPCGLSRRRQAHCRPHGLNITGKCAVPRFLRGADETRELSCPASPVVKPYHRQKIRVIISGVQGKPSLDLPALAYFRKKISWTVIPALFETVTGPVMQGSREILRNLGPGISTVTVHHPRRTGPHRRRGLKIDPATVSSPAIATQADLDGTATCSAAAEFFPVVQGRSDLVRIDR